MSAKGFGLTNVEMGWNAIPLVSLGSAIEKKILLVRTIATRVNPVGKSVFGELTGR
jgi:hypothetical protein